jgi:hypothetical protein
LTIITGLEGGNQSSATDLAPAIIICGLLVQVWTQNKNQSFLRVYGKLIRPPHIRLLYRTVEDDEIVAEISMGDVSKFELHKLFNLLQKVHRIREMCRRLPLFGEMVRRIESVTIVADVISVPEEEQSLAGDMLRSSEFKNLRIVF